MAPDQSRRLEVVVWGATGFTGALVAQYLASQEGVRWAVAGRSQEKLEAVVNGLVAVRSPPQIAACSIDRTARLDELVASTRVVLSTAGPFAKIGTPIIESCLRNGTDYCDITGEVAWVRDMMDKHAKEALAKGIIFCSCCGFDSAPSDLGVLFGANKLRETYGASTAVGAVSNYAAMRGGLSGGTLASGINMEKDPRLAKMMKDPFLLGGAPSGGARPGDLDFEGAEFDASVGAWIAPFGMATINTRIVRRSNELVGYGPTFQYREVSLAPSEKAAQKLARGGPPAEKRAELVEAGRLPKPGQGPPPEVRAKSWFRMTLRVEAAQDPSKAVLVQVSGGDPGYDETAKMVAEAALCLARERDVLPRQAGFLTPASAMGTHLIERFERSGIHFAQVSAQDVARQLESQPAKL